MSTIEQQLTEATSEIDRLNAQLVSERGAAADALAAEVARTRSLTEVDCYVVEVANHMIDLKHDQGAAEQVRDVHNAKRSDPHPDNEVRVVRLRGGSVEPVQGSREDRLMGWWRGDIDASEWQVRSGAGKNKKQLRLVFRDHRGNWREFATIHTGIEGKQALWDAANEICGIHNAMLSVKTAGLGEPQQQLPF